MILREISDTSIAISLFRYFCRWYRSLEQRISYMYHNSQIYRLSKGFRKKVKICFRYSFLGKISEPKQTTSIVSSNSLAVQYLINSYKRWKDNVIYYSKSSLTTGVAKDTKERLNSSPVKIISTILITAIFVNAVLIVVLQKQIDLWGFLIRLLFLFIATVGISCELGWPAIKTSSLFLKKCEYRRDAQKD